MEELREIVLDVARDNVSTVTMKQADINSRFVLANLYDKGNKIVVPATAVVLLNVCRYDGSTGSFRCSVNEDGTVKVPIPAWAVEYAYPALCDISIIEINEPNTENLTAEEIRARGSKLSSFNFTMKINRAARTNDDVVEDDNHDILVDLISDVEELKEIAFDDAERAEAAATEASGSATAAAQSAEIASSSAAEAGNSASAAQTAWQNLLDTDAEAETLQPDEEATAEWITDPQTGERTLKIGVPKGEAGTIDHRDLQNRDAEDQHPMSAITGLETALAGKQPTISDLQQIRENAVSGALAYHLPTNGIPSSDMTEAVQQSLDKADSALQEHQSLAAYRTAAAQDIIDATKLPAAEKGTANGVAELDATGKVPPSQLPSYVDDVVEYPSVSGFPATGESGKIYVATDTNKTYRWGGTEYVVIASDLALGETSATAYRGDRGKTAYDHSQTVSGNPHNVSKSDVGLGNVDNTADADKPLSTAAQTALGGKVDKVTGKSLSTNDYTNEEKTKLSGIENGAQVNPTALPNPNALTFTGAVSGSYDGSAAKTVAIPSVAGVVAPAYSSETTYLEGDLVIHDGALFSANQNIDTPEAWNSAHWTQVTADDVFVKYLSIIVTCTTQDGVTVTGQTVTLRQGREATSPVYATAPYNGQPVTFKVLPGFEYFVSVSDNLAGHFAPTTANGLVTATTLVTLTYDDLSHITTFDGVMTVVETFEDPSVLIGNVEIADTWTDDNGTVYNDPKICVDVREVEDADGVKHLAAIMQSKWATKNTIQFDAAENEEATEVTATEGLYYVGKNGTTYTKLGLNTGDTVPYSDYEKIYHNEINFDGNMVQYGYNRWSHSAYRQYLNSDLPGGEWWHSQHVGDVAPSQAGLRGYLAGCSEAFLAAAKPIKITCNLNTVTDGGVLETTVDKIWLPSGTEMYGSVNSGEGTYFPYWKKATGLSSPANGANPGRIQYAIENHTSAQHVRCRSANRNYSYIVWVVNTGGNLNGGNAANNSYRAVPACAIYRAAESE